MIKKTGIFLIATSLLFTATACGGSEAPTTPSASAGIESIEVTKAEAGLIRFVAQGTIIGDEKTFTDDNFLMTDPQSKFAINAYTGVSSMPLDGEEIHAAGGEVFHLITYTSNYSNHGVGFSVVIDNSEPKPIPAEMPMTGVLLVSAPEDADIIIEVSSGNSPGQTTDVPAVIQSIDVKTAERLSDNMEVWYKNRQGSVQDPTMRGEGGSSPYALTVTSTVQDVFRSAYVEGMGYAPDGSAFIYATVSEPSFKLEKHGTAQEDSFKVVLTAKDGKTYSGDRDGDAYVFTVPVAEDDFTIHAEASSTITLSGKVVTSVQGLTTSKATVAF